MAMGVRAVVAAGWAVDDRAAAEFARAFYDRMLDGESFGPAVPQRPHRRPPERRWRVEHVGRLPVLRRPGVPHRHVDAAPAPAASRPCRPRSSCGAVEALAVKAGDAGIDIATVREELRRLDASPEPRRGAITATSAPPSATPSSACGDLADAVRAVPPGAGARRPATCRSASSSSSPTSRCAWPGRSVRTSVVIDDDRVDRRPAARLGAPPRRHPRRPAGRRRSAGRSARGCGRPSPCGCPGGERRPALKEAARNYFHALGDRRASRTGRTTPCSSTAPAAC